MSKSLESVCAVVVTYNRKSMLLENLRSLLSQSRSLDAIIIVDNASTDGTQRELMEQGYIDTELPQKKTTPGIMISEKISESVKIINIHSDENLGGAGGFRIGCDIAHQRGYDWIWIMDDDAEPTPDCLSKLLECTALHPSTPFFAPRIVHQTGSPQYYHHKKRIDLLRCKELTLRGIEINRDYDLEATAFVGPLIRASTIEKIGLPDASYFIWLDDLEYTYRLTRTFGKGVLVSGAIIVHKDIQSIGTSLNFNWKTYYAIRNSIKFYWKYAGIAGKTVITLRAVKSYFRYFRRADSKRKLWQYSVGFLLSRQKQ